MQGRGLSDETPGAPQEACWGNRAEVRDSPTVFGSPQGPVEKLWRNMGINLGTGVIVEGYPDR